MLAFIDLSDQGHEEPVPTKVLAILFLNERQLYAVTTLLDGAPWFALIHEDSDALISVEPEPDPPRRNGGGFFFYGRTTVVVGCCAGGGVTTVVDAGSRLTVSV
jgi:hypothetical protein